MHTTSGLREKNHADTSPETTLCRTSNISRATNKKGLPLSMAAAISHRVPFGSFDDSQIIIYAFIIVNPKQKKTASYPLKLVRSFLCHHVEMRNFCSVYVMDGAYIQLSLTAECSSSLGPQEEKEQLWSNAKRKTTTFSGMKNKKMKTEIKIITLRINHLWSVDRLHHLVFSLFGVRSFIFFFV